MHFISDTKVRLITVFALMLALVNQAAIKWGYAESPGSQTTLLVVMDDSSHKAYFQVTGPANSWFSWGYGNMMMPHTPATVFGAAGQGSLLDVYMSDYTQPASVSNLGGTQAAENISFCVVSNATAFYSFAYPLTALDPWHYNFSTASSSLWLVYAVGTTLGTGGNYGIHSAAGVASVTTTNAPQACLAAASVKSGAIELSLTEVMISVTNQLQFTTNLNSAGWTTLTNLVLQPPCGSNVLSQFITLTLPRSNSPAMFWRLKQ